MSLNGLDDPKIVEAYQTVLPEPGSWFLIKYASRDEVELLSHGTGGIVEVRGVIGEYEDTSPLYGFLRYRRRNVIIKYLPEDCSRLIQARVAVHFNAVCERFSPYDTIFEIATAGELRDTKLSAACSLHAASGSTSSSTSSLRRRRLVEIAEEDEEEQQRAPKRQSVASDTGDPRPRSPADGASPAVPVTLDSDLAVLPEQSKFSADTTSEPPKFVGAQDRPPTAIDDDARSDVLSYSSYPYSKPKVKLGPRPSIDALGRPQTAGNFRPVSAIPAGFKLFGKGSKRSKDRDSSAASSPQEEIPTINFSPDAIPAADGSLRPATSSGVMPSNAAAMTVPTSTKRTITPEKARLMKAMKMREKKKKDMESAAAAPPTIEIPAEEESVDVSEETIEDENSLRVESDADKRASVDKEDSGISIDPLSSSIHTDPTSDLAQSDSRPGSPVVGSSEAEQSTKASSVSESTDETVQAKDDSNDPKDDATGSESESGEQTSTGELETPILVVEETTVPDQAIETPEPVVQAAEITSSDSATEPQAVAAEESTTTTGSSPADDAVAPEASIERTSHDDSGDEYVAEPRESMHLPISKFSTRTSTPPTFSHNRRMESEMADTTLSPTGSSAIPDAESEATSPRLRIPRSKFSTQDLKAAAKASTSPTPVSTASVLEESPFIVATDTTADEHDDSDTQTIPAGEEEEKRRTLVQPIRTDLAQHDHQTPQAEAHLADDEDLTRELHSAPVEEAKSMSVSRTPKSPVFPDDGTAPPFPKGPHMVRTTSNPVHGPLVVPMDVSQPSARSMSSGAAYLHKVTQQQPSGSLAIKSNVGSSISQRIKALEKLSASSGEAPAPPPSRERPSSTFFPVKKREPSRSPSVVDRLRKETPPSPSQSQESSPEASKFTRRERSNSVASRLSMFESPPPGASWANAGSYSPSATQRGRPESISVTAKIIRDPNHSLQQSLEPPKDPSEYGRLDLKQSPLFVDHQRAMREPPAVPVEPVRDNRSGSQDDGKGRRSSLSIVRDFIKERRKSVTSSSPELAAPATGDSWSPTRPPSVQQTSSFSHRLSISSRRSSVSKDRETQISPPANQESFGDDNKSNSDKRTSRAGRFMRRISTLSGSRGKAATPPALSPSVKEEEGSEPRTTRPAMNAAASGAATGAPFIASYLGDVNVQFPDNLLWKRRNMCLDSQGFLILSALPAQSGRPTAQGTKRYHLSEFRVPYAPDVEVQELPNSVVLEFVESTGIQVACEDRAGQINVLHILQDAHAGHGTYGQ